MWVCACHASVMSVLAFCMSAITEHLYLFSIFDLLAITVLLGGRWVFSPFRREIEEAQGDFKSFCHIHVEAQWGTFFQALYLWALGSLRVAQPHVISLWQGTRNVQGPWREPALLVCVWAGEKPGICRRPKRKGKRVNIQSNICMGVKNTTCFYCHLIGRMCAACEYPLISGAVALCWYQ